MRITKRDTLFEGKHLRFVRKDAETGKGDKIAWETVERVNIHGRGAVVIIAVTGDRELILERNWRAPSESYIIQLPAGLTDIKGESEEETARRELLEETGYKADKLIPIVSLPLSPDLTSTSATHFFAPHVEFAGRTGEDLSEEIELLKVPLRELDDFLLSSARASELDLRVPGIIWILERMKLL